MEASLGAQEWHVEASITAQRTHNPIRALVDQMKLEPNPDKAVIALSIGDPTKFGNLPVAPEVLDAVKDALVSGDFNGYPPSIGYESARAAIAEEHSTDTSPVAAKDVIIASGCSGALEIAISALCQEGQNLLVPAPGFSLYRTVAHSKAIETRSYRLLPDKDWECDLAHMASLIDDNTGAIVITNPSNPCGSVFSKNHLLAILEVAEKYHVPIIADEIYRGLVFKGEESYELAPLSKKVPIISCGGLAKKYVVPGWRLGWIIVHDRDNIFGEKIRLALVSLSQLILGANSVIQGALPRILKDTPQSYVDGILDHLEANAKLCFSELSKVPGLRPVMPRGAMYLLVELKVDEFPDIPDDRVFTEMLMSEESVFCLPAVVFEAPNFFRIVTCVPQERMQEAMARITGFCARHHQK